MHNRVMCIFLNPLFMCHTGLDTCKTRTEYATLFDNMICKTLPQVERHKHVYTAGKYSSII